MHPDPRLRHPRLEAAIDLAVRALRAACRWLVEQHRRSERMLKHIAERRGTIDRLLP
jgi:hypothetical protein